MKITRQRQQRIKGKIQNVRASLMAKNPFFALLLMHMDFYASDRIKTISTDGRYIYFDVDFFDRLYEYEAEFLLCHILLHIVLGDTNRPSQWRGDGYHHACDMLNNKLLGKYGYTTKRYPHLGGVYNEPDRWVDREDATAFDLYCALPYDVSDFDEEAAARFMFDTDFLWGRPVEMAGECVLILEKDMEVDAKKAKFVKDEEETAGKGGCDGEGSGEGNKRDNAYPMSAVDSNELKTEEITGIIEAVLKLLTDKKGKSGAGIEAVLKRRGMPETKKSKIDWRSILINFVQEEITDYSFTPPDRRFDDGTFFLPDFNVPDETVKDILFMIDASGSMSDKMIGEAYSAVKGAIDQFEGKLSGYLGFFDFDVQPPVSFDSVESLKKILPFGGGGTSFDIIFDYVRDKMASKPPASIIILTDGFAPFPPETARRNIPVLWLLNNDEVVPPWGKTARIE